jgi:transposase InsO family protein
MQAIRSRHRRGLPGQLHQRLSERQTRLRVLSFARWMRWGGCDRGAIAHAIGISVSTLAEWERRWADLDDRLQPAALGAPARQSDPVLRTAVFAMIAIFGPELGVPSLQEAFPSASRGELWELLGRARRDFWNAERSRWYSALSWNQAGAVWAMDYFDPPRRIDGIYRAVLCVRDLASGLTLASLPVEHADADSTVASLTSLFLQHGPPLVLKADNGSHFTADTVRALLRHWRIELLLSPPYTPSYNGSCEAGNGAIKTRVEHLAKRDGTPGHWSANHLEAARLWSNRRIPDGQLHSAEDRWNQRPPLSDSHRDQMAVAIAGSRRRRLAQHECAKSLDSRISTLSSASLERYSIAEALIGIGYLTIRSRRIPQPLSKKNLSDIA